SISAASGASRAVAHSRTVRWTRRCSWLSSNSTPPPGSVFVTAGKRSFAGRGDGRAARRDDPAGAKFHRHETHTEVGDEPSGHLSFGPPGPDCTVLARHPPGEPPVHGRGGRHRHRGEGPHGH